jgi:hypothetical protein
MALKYFIAAVLFASGASAGLLKSVSTAVLRGLDNTNKVGVTPPMKLASCCAGGGDDESSSSFYANLTTTMSSDGGVTLEQ